jgi:Polymorphic toxin system, DSP-PTPase phosphatase
MKPSIYLVADNLPGKLYIMPKPSGEWLKEDVEYYGLIGIDMIISMLERDEASELMLERQGEICKQGRLAFTQFPIVDRGLPEIVPFTSLILQIIDDLKNGTNIAVHCRAGIGRSGIAVCSALLGFGYSPTDAMKLTSEARGVEVPDTEQQRNFIGQMVTVLNGTS